MNYNSATYSSALNSPLHIADESRPSESVQNTLFRHAPRGTLAAGATPASATLRALDELCTAQWFGVPWLLTRQTLSRLDYVNCVCPNSIAVGRSTSHNPHHRQRFSQQWKDGPRRGRNEIRGPDQRSALADKYPYGLDHPKTCSLGDAAALPSGPPSGPLRGKPRGSTTSFWRAPARYGRAPQAPWKSSSTLLMQAQ